MPDTYPCPKCGTDRLPGKGGCKQCLRDASARWRERNHADLLVRWREKTRQYSERERICPQCGVLYVGWACKPCKAARAQSARWRATRQRHGKQRSSAAWQTLLEGYGGRCYCCGESDAAFLTIDHAQNDGYLNRTASGKRRRGTHVYEQIIAAGFPSTLRLACFNCNCGRAIRSSNQICPHSPDWSNERNRKHLVVYRYNQRLFEKVLEGYGRKCYCCGEGDWRFLTIDHTDGDGCRDLHPSGKRRKGASVYKVAVAEGFPARFRLACFNCNHAAWRVRSTTCPHNAPQGE